MNRYETWREAIPGIGHITSWPPVLSEEESHALELGFEDAAAYWSECTEDFIGRMEDDERWERS